MRHTPTRNAIAPFRRHANWRDRHNRSEAANPNRRENGQFPFRLRFSFLRGWAYTEAGRPHSADHSSLTPRRQTTRRAVNPHPRRTSALAALTLRSAVEASENCDPNETAKATDCEQFAAATMLGGNYDWHLRVCASANYSQTAAWRRCLTPSGSTSSTPLRSLLRPPKHPPATSQTQPPAAVALRKHLRSVTQIESGGDRQDADTAQITFRFVRRLAFETGKTYGAHKLRAWGFTLLNPVNTTRRYI